MKGDGAAAAAAAAAAEDASDSGEDGGGDALHGDPENEEGQGDSGSEDEGQAGVSLSLVTTSRWHLFQRSCTLDVR